MSPEQVTDGLLDALKKPNGKQALRHYYAKISRLDHQVLLSGLLGVFKTKSYTAHDWACAMLWTLAVPFTRDLSESLPDLLENWDLSSEELVFYLMDVIEKEEFDRVMEELSQTWANTEDYHHKLKTVQYWRSVSSESYVAQKESWKVKLASITDR